MFSLLLAWKHIGLGLHMDLVLATDPNLLVTGGRYFYVATMFFDSSICLPKLSAIFFYARVFRTNDRSLRLQLWALGLIVAGWLLSAYLVTIFQCHPIQRAWNTALPGTCVNTYRWFLATAALSCVIDIWILVVPIPRIWGLQASRRRRIYLLGAFFLAYSVIVLSVGRLVATVQLVPRLAHDETWEMPVYMYWAALEASISIISVSTPNATALVKSLWHRDPPSRRGPKITGHSSSGYGSMPGKSRGHPRPIGSGATDHDSIDKLVPGGDLEAVVSGPGDHVSETDIALGDIRVKTDIQVSRK